MNNNQKNKQKTNVPLWGILLFFILIAIDQLTKLFADVYFNAQGAPDKITLVDGWLWLRITYNRGISYGIGGDASPVLKIAVVALTALMMAGLALWSFKLDKSRNFLRIALVFIVAGGVGNLIDRVYYRVWDPATTPLGVRDMVDLSKFGFAVCNFADFFISAGAVMLVLSLLFFDKDAVFPIGKYKKLAQAEEAKKAEEAVQAAQTAEVEADAKEETNG